MSILENNTLSPAESLRLLAEKIQVENQLIQLLRKEIGKVIIGQNYMIDRLLIALLADGHILLEGVPGLAKTLAIKSLSQALEASFRLVIAPSAILNFVIVSFIICEAVIVSSAICVAVIV